MKHTTLLLALATMFAVQSQAQCRKFTKKNCLPTLDGYVQNDNYNSAVLIPGDEAELELTFLGDTEYRVAVCAHPVLNDVEFNVLNQENILLWSNSDGSDHLDFRMENAQRLRFRVKVPETDAAILHEGCVSILVGSKD
ncbi:MAG: hypothetical protein VYA72_02115 [Bacteroidota bacterium]|nr:hypothetical protein [Bacteroidota bacterium]